MTVDEAYRIVRECDPAIREAFAIWIATTEERFRVLTEERLILMILSDDLKQVHLERVKR